MAISAALVREVKITKDEFIRQLPDAIGDRQFQVDGDTVCIDNESGRITIQLKQNPDRHVGKMELPMLHVGFSFDGMTDEEVCYFMEHYDAHKMRGSDGMQLCEGATPIAVRSGLEIIQHGGVYLNALVHVSCLRRPRILR